MIGQSELRINCVARPAVARPIRHAVATFLAATGVDVDVADDILTAVGEALANAVEHAYDPACPSDLELHAQFHGQATLAVEVWDRGRFVQRDERPGRGFGLRIVRAIAREVSLEITDGTHVRMLFDAPIAPPRSAHCRPPR